MKTILPLDHYKKISDVMLFTPDIYTDFRGDLWTYYKKDDFPIDLQFNHDKFSTSRKNVLRGIHGDYKSWKLITCVYGELYFVVVDYRKDSPTYMEWRWHTLNDRKREIVLLPPGVGNGFLVMSEHSVFSYKWAYPGEYPDISDQFTIKWDDPQVNIYWPISNPILSPRDS